MIIRAVVCIMQFIL